jgi:CBS-domain-containing membrane protein
MRDYLNRMRGGAALLLLGPTWLSMALAVASATLLMHLTRTIHPPAGSNPVIVILSVPSWHFLITPTLIGAVALVAVAVALNDIFEGDAYPRYWL